MSELLTEDADQGLVEQARALGPLLERNAERCEQERRIPDENLAALDEASRHAFLATAPVLEVYGRATFGLEQIMDIV